MTRAPSDPLRIALWGDGSLGVAALHAAAASDDLQLDAVLFQTLLSYDDWANTRYYEVPVGLIVPGILQDYDLDDLTWAVSIRRFRPAVIWINPVDGSQSRIPSDEVRNRLERTAKLRGVAGVEDIARLVTFDAALGWPDAAL
jgi:hypothetical protein